MLNVQIRILKGDKTLFLNLTYKVENSNESILNEIPDFMNYEINNLDIDYK